jgi:single-stranded-DNA-specific exonuclease
MRPKGTDMLQRLKAAMAAAIEELRQWPAETIQILHHNDADGLTSGAVLTRAFERSGYAVKRLCLEKPYTAVLEKLLAGKGRVIVFADFAGRIAPLISEINRGRNLVLILDHHKAIPSTDARVYNLDPELFGLTGDRDITASTTCYLFAVRLDPANADLAAIAAVGAVGDGFFVDGRLSGPNRGVAQEAVGLGTMEIESHAGGETYRLKSRQGAVACEALAAELNTFGAAGYFRHGPEMGIRVCLNGTGPESDRLLADLQAIRSRAFLQEIDRLKKGGLMTTGHLQWFHVGERFAPMGVKMIGVFCEHVKDESPFHPDKFIAGFQTIPNEVPGFGPVRLNQVKISMRASTSMRSKIRSGMAPGLDTFLPEATAQLGGFSDACHSLAAATTVAIGKEEALIQKMEQILSV